MAPTLAILGACIEQLRRSYHAPLHRYLVQMVGSQDIAEELTGRCFEYVHRTYTAEQMMFPRAILFQVATGFALTYLRLRHSEGRNLRNAVLKYSKGGLPESDSRPPHRQAMAQQISDRLVVAIKELRPAYRRVFVMALLQGKNPKEIAAAVGVPEGRVDKRMTKAIKMCCVRLAEDGVDLTDLFRLG